MIRPLLLLLQLVASPMSAIARPSWHPFSQICLKLALHFANPQTSAGRVWGERGRSVWHYGVYTCHSRCPSSSGFHMQATVEEPQIGLVLHNTSRVGLPIFSYLSLGLKGFIRTRLHRVKSIKGASLLLGKPLSILNHPLFQIIDINPASRTRAITISASRL
jgi:hypothetical protein